MAQRARAIAPVALVLVATLAPLLGLGAQAAGQAWGVVASPGAPVEVYSARECCGALYVAGSVEPAGGGPQGLLLVVKGGGVEAYTLSGGSGGAFEVRGLVAVGGRLYLYGRMDGLPGIAVVGRGGVEAYALKAVGKWRILAGTVVYLGQAGAGGLVVVAAAKGHWGFMDRWFTIVALLSPALNVTGAYSLEMPPPRLVARGGGGTLYLVATRPYRGLYIVGYTPGSASAEEVQVSLSGLDLRPSSTLLAGGSLYIAGTAVRVESYDERAMILKLTPGLGVEYLKLFKAMSVNRLTAAAPHDGGLLVAADIEEPEHGTAYKLVLEAGPDASIGAALALGAGPASSVEVKALKPHSSTVEIVGLLDSTRLPASPSPMIIEAPWPPSGTHNLEATSGPVHLGIKLSPAPKWLLDKLRAGTTQPSYKVSHATINATRLDASQLTIAQVSAGLKAAKVITYKLAEAATASPTTTHTTKTTPAATTKTSGQATHTTSTRTGQATASSPATTATQAPMTNTATQKETTPAKSNTAKLAAMGLGAVVIAIIAVVLAKR
ncbi:MAG: hypothetical protein GSR80_001020 [Desulfurococcales archaeon]|nr:hypothetical protein [Desulfurococcales archaeon]